MNKEKKECGRGEGGGTSGGIDGEEAEVGGGLGAVRLGRERVRSLDINLIRPAVVVVRVVHERLVGQVGDPVELSLKRTRSGD